MANFIRRILQFSLVVLSLFGVHGNKKYGVIPEDDSDSFVCKKSGNSPHPVYCDYYYNCVNGKATLRKCTGSLVFDITRNFCSSRSQVKCGSRIISTDVTEATTKTTEPITTTTKRLTTRPTKPVTTTRQTTKKASTTRLPPTKPTKKPSTTRLPPTKPTKPITTRVTTIKPTKPITTRLPPTKPTKPIPTTTTKKRKPTKPVTRTSTERITTTAGIVTTSSPYDICKNLPRDEDCPETCGVFPVRTNCEEFVICTYGHSKRYTCPKGMIFDRDLFTCNTESDVFNCPCP